MAHIKGALIAARRAFVVESFGQDAWESLLATLDPEEREVLQGLVLAINWYPLELATRLEHAIVRVLGGGDPTLYDAMGAHSAGRNLRSLYAAFVSTNRDPAGFFSRLLLAYPQMHDFGSAAVEGVRAASMDLVHDYAGHANVGFCRVSVGFFRAASEVLAPSAVSVKEVACQAKGLPRCVIRVRWTPRAAPV